MISNPSALGGPEKRKGFAQRANDLFTSFEHHLAIAKNLPLDDVIKWITSLAPKGMWNLFQKMISPFNQC